MTRTEKVERIKRYHPSLYSSLRRSVPNLVISPSIATEKDIDIYNKLVSIKGDQDKNPFFKKRFSF